MKSQKIIYTATRVYADRGLREAGQTERVSEDFARQVIAQGFARAAVGPKSAPAVEKSKE